MDNTKKLPLKEKIAYACGGIGTITYFMVVGSFLLFVYTDLIKINPTTAANIFLFTRFWDAINDPIMGSIVDKKPFVKSGKGMYRPWMLYGIIPLAICFVLCFWIPGGIASEGGKVAWCVGWYVLYTMAQTFIQVPFGSLSNCMTTDPGERGSLGAIRNLGENISNVIVSATMLPLVNLFSGGRNDIVGYFGAAASLAVLASIFIFISWKGVKERGVDLQADHVQKFTVGESFSAFFKNRAAISMVLALLIAAIFINFRFAWIMYYGTYYLGLDGGGVTSLFTAGTVLSIVAFIPVNWMLSHMNKRTIFLICAAVCVLDGVVFLLAKQSFAGAIAGQLIFGFIMAISFSTIWGTIPDTVEYGEWKSGIRTPAFVFALVTFAQKCGIGLASWLAATALASFGYVAGADPTPAVSNGIYQWNAWIMIIGGIALALATIFYPMTNAKFKEILAELSERR